MEEISLPTRNSTKPLNLSEEQTIRVSDADIARRAYEIYEQREAQHGQEIDDWLQAENELRMRVSGDRID